MAELTDPAYTMTAVTKSDTVPIAGGATRGLYVGGTGDLIVKGGNGVQVTFKAVPAGAVLPIRVNFVMAATSATDIVALS